MHRQKFFFNAIVKVILELENMIYNALFEHYFTKNLIWKNSLHHYFYHFHNLELDTNYFTVIKPKSDKNVVFIILKEDNGCLNSFK